MTIKGDKIRDIIVTISPQSMVKVLIMEPKIREIILRGFSGIRIFIKVTLTKWIGEPFDGIGKEGVRLSLIADISYI